VIDSARTEDYLKIRFTGSSPRVAIVNDQRVFELSMSSHFYWRKLLIDMQPAI
jgi:hypothetical protein